MDVFNRLHHLIHEGRDSEARELFFAEAFPWLETFNIAVDHLLEEDNPIPDAEELWEKIRDRYKDL